jgi:sporulation protein YlmC with PRC-barrel domain
MQSIALSATTIINDKVVNFQNVDLGRIDEIMLDLKSGRIAYAILSLGGLPEMRDKLFAIPWGALTLDDENKRFILDIDEETLKAAPGFDLNDWPDMTTPEWHSMIHAYYGLEPYWAASDWKAA